MRQLRGTKAIHKTASEESMQTVRSQVENALQAIKEGNCTKAYMRITNMWAALGRAQAESSYAGGTPWEPTSKIAELGYQFSMRCLRDEPVALGASRRHRRAR